LYKVRGSEKVRRIEEGNTLAHWAAYKQHTHKWERLLKERVQVAAALAERNRINSTVAKHTVLNLLRSFGCAAPSTSRTVRDLRVGRLQRPDEIWALVEAKKKNVTVAQRREDG
jgi:hypothetical protein